MPLARSRRSLRPRGRGARSRTPRIPCRRWLRSESTGSGFPASRMMVHQTMPRPRPRPRLHGTEVGPRRRCTAATPRPPIAGTTSAATMTTTEPERGYSFRHGNGSRRVTLVRRSSWFAARRLHGLPVPRMGGVAIASDRDAERASVPGWGVCKSRAGHWSTICFIAPYPRGQVSH